jgi:hypothetical protein
LTNTASTPNSSEIYVGQRKPSPNKESAGFTTGGATGLAGRGAVDSFGVITTLVDTAGVGNFVTDGLAPVAPFDDDLAGALGCSGACGGSPVPESESPSSALLPSASDSEINPTSAAFEGGNFACFVFEARGDATSFKTLVLFDIEAPLLDVEAALLGRSADFDSLASSSPSGTVVSDSAPRDFACFLPYVIIANF